MDLVEQKILYASIALMLIFAALVLYAGLDLGIALPGCNDHIPPFKSSKVVTKQNNQFDIYYVARMWAFEPAELVLPEKADVNVYVSAIDVNHGLQIAGTNVNLMGVPGTVNAAHQHFDHIGDYLVICHEYCGLNHQNMIGKIRVVSAPEYERIMREQAARISAIGEKLAAELQCTACHTSDGTEGIGPTFKGIFGRTVTLADGTHVVADDAYLIDSIKAPDHQIVKGYDKGSMPETPMTDEQIEELVQYLKTIQ